MCGLCICWEPISTGVTTKTAGYTRAVNSARCTQSVQPDKKHPAVGRSKQLAKVAGLLPHKQSYSEGGRETAKYVDGDDV